METREYFEKVMQDYNQNRKGRSLRKYCKDEAVDYDWLIEFKKSYRSNQLQPNENKKIGKGEFIALTVEENFVPEQQTPAGWQVPYSYDEAFIFYSKDYRKVKILHYDINGFVLYQKGKKDMWVVRLFFYQKQEVYCKEYKIARFNVPGSDPQSSKYPQSIIKGNPLMPSFCRFYLESKFAYHLSENRLLDMLSQMGMKVAQSTLNGWMQQIMTYLRERLGPVMLERIRQCVYTQNDESRIVVRSRESKEDKFKYNVEYIHAALSMEAKLCVMEYKEGSRSHSVQEDAIFKDSCIRVFTADRAVLYETIEKDLEEMGLVRTACWFHARHRFVDAYISDHRVRVIILMMNYLFQIERESKIRKHTAKQRRRFRLKYSASIVGKLMKLLKKIKLDSSYGAMVQRAVNYVLDDEKAFKVFLQDGRVEMHNNAVERMFRHLAMGRRNWMHTGSHLGAENIAFMFSLFESCKLNDINFGDYIEDILTRLMEGEQDFMSLIPCNYNSNKKVNAKAA